MLLTQIPPDGRAVHVCPVCRTCYTSQEEALRCNRTRDAQYGVYAPGDVIVIAQGYCWHERDEWLAPKKFLTKNQRANLACDARGEKRPHNHDGDRNFLYVVTAVGHEADVHSPRPFQDNRQEHATVLFVASRALIARDRDDWVHAWTPATRHRTILPRLGTNDPGAVRARAEVTAAGLMGKQNVHLL